MPRCFPGLLLCLWLDAKNPKFCDFYYSSGRFLSGFFIYLSWATKISKTLSPPDDRSTQDLISSMLLQIYLCLNLFLPTTAVQISYALGTSFTIIKLVRFLGRMLY